MPTIYRVILQRPEQCVKCGKAIPKGRAAVKDKRGRRGVKPDYYHPTCHKGQKPKSASEVPAKVKPPPDALTASVANKPEMKPNLNYYKSQKSPQPTS